MIDSDRLQDGATKPFSRFTTEIMVRPDDIDLNQHVHNTRYLEYVLAARYEQMERCYKMAMNEFIALGFGWFVKSTFIEYKRQMGLGDTAVVSTWIMGIEKTGVKVGFDIVRKSSGKLCSAGWIEYTMINLSTGRAEVIPASIIEKYSV